MTRETDLTEVEGAAELIPNRAVALLLRVGAGDRGERPGHRAANRNVGANGPDAS
jgi:hypothetical protein